MYTIGDVLKIVNISANTLRYYDEIGLLKPCMVKIKNQYRYYSDFQIKEITFILELKQYGFSLDEIKIQLQNKSNKKLKTMLEDKRVELCKEIARLEERHIFLEKRISKIAEEDELKMKEGKVLIVDDFALARKVIRNIIEEYGNTVVGEASNGEEAIVAYDALKPELVIMDITMPKMDGIDATAKIMKKYKNARIIMCSAMSQASIILDSIKAGARDFTSKPISSLRLIQAMERGLDDNHSFKPERIDIIAAMIEKRWNEKVFSRTLKQEQIDLLIFENVNVSVSEQDEAINNIFNKIEFDSSNEQEYSISGQFTVELKTITYLKDKFSELSQESFNYFSNQFNSECTLELIKVENITMSEFRTLLTTDSDIGTIKYNISSLPIHIHVSGGFGNNKEILRELLEFTAKNLKRIILSFNTTTNMIMSLNVHEAFKENYSTILISFSIEFANEDKGFVMISLPHDFLQYLPK